MLEYLANFVVYHDNDDYFMYLDSRVTGHLRTRVQYSECALMQKYDESIIIKSVL